VSKPSKKPARKLPDSTALASELAAAARPQMTNVEADRIYIAIGIGEALDAIEVLITVIARKRIPVTEELAATVNTWLDCHRGHNAEPRLRKLIANAKTYRPQPMSTATQQPAHPGMPHDAHGTKPERDSI
jgi:hypothetical protein